MLASPQQRAWIKRCVDVSIGSVLLFFALRSEPYPWSSDA